MEQKVTAIENMERRIATQITKLKGDQKEPWIISGETTINWRT